MTTLIPKYSKVTSANRTIAEKFSETISVKDFGAVGDGVTDDTAAIQAAFDYVAANSVGDHTAVTGYIGYSFPTLLFPTGIYLSGQISTPKYFKVIGESSAVIKSLTGTTSVYAGIWIDSWVVNGYIDGLSFLYFATVLQWDSHNINESFHTLKNISVSCCSIFFDQISFDACRSTTTVLDRIHVAAGVAQAARIYSDISTISNCWFYHTENSYQCFIDSHCYYVNNICVPVSGGTDKAHIFFQSHDEARSLTIESCRFGAEAGQCPVVVVGNMLNPFVGTQYTNRGVTISNSHMASYGDFDPLSLGAVRANVVLLDTASVDNTIKYVKFNNCYGGPDLTGGVIQHYGTKAITDVVSTNFVIEVDQSSAFSFSSGLSKICPTYFLPYLSTPIQIRKTENLSLGSGKIATIETATTGVFKTTFTVDFQFPTTFPTPVLLEVILIGRGDNALPSTSGIYSSFAKYLLTINGTYSAGAKVSIATAVQLNVSGAANSAAISSAHFGSADTGATTQALSGTIGANVYDVTIVFGTELANADAYIRPLYDFSFAT